MLVVYLLLHVYINGTDTMITPCASFFVLKELIAKVTKFEVTERAETIAILLSMGLCKKCKKTSNRAKNLRSVRILSTRGGTTG